MKYRNDLILGEAFCIFIFFHFLDSGISVLNGFDFNFDAVIVKTENKLDTSYQSIQSSLKNGFNTNNFQAR